MRKRIVVASVAAVLAALTIGGCSAAPAVTAKPAPANADPMQADDAKQRLKFPNTKQTVFLQGYDDTVGMVRFRLQVWQPGGPDGGHFVTDPTDSAPHRLALSADPTILSANQLCSDGEVTVDSDGAGTKPCTADQLIDTVRDGGGLLAKIQIDAADHITKLAEIYTP
ncbi:hypothetical protein [Amycolatopsis pithecellobii]|uniref:CHRD domain-containing protein n=1 Tax=Amycolatopsis pithecellobii TaxID=664692 RepID=A0A6N7Z8D6_9PSEU|nr:hypothetical protein [Amycolatopsis pithecellobii]MTD56706.1 hypothetical protein [Amycolatopsis pithecellobii]